MYVRYLGGSTHLIDILTTNNVSNEASNSSHNAQEFKVRFMAITNFSARLSVDRSERGFPSERVVRLHPYT